MRVDPPSAEGSLESCALLASAIAGRSMGVTVAGDGIAHTDGRAIFVPGQSSKSDARVIVVAHAALAAAGSLDVAILTRLLGRPKTAARYFRLEVVRAVRTLGAYVPRSAEARLLALATGRDSRSPQDSLARAQAEILMPPPPAWLGTLRPHKLLRHQSLLAALTGFREDPGSKAQMTVEIDEADDDEATDDSRILRLLSSPGSDDNFISRFLRDHIFNIRRTPDAGASVGGDELPVGPARAAAQLGEHAFRAERPAELAALESFAAVRVTKYPEWHDEKSTYRPDWCAVSELDPAAAEAGATVALPADPRLQRGLARLGHSFQTHRRRHDGESLDLRALVDFAIARQAGEAGDERVYETRLRTAHDLGVVILLDASGSQAEQRADGFDVWAEQQTLAANLIKGLEAVGDRVAAYGFRSHSRHDVRLLRIKDFDGRFDAGGQSRLAALKPGGFTRLGAAIRHASAIATDRSGASRRLLVLISDGVPFEEGYEGRHAEADTRRALDEAVMGGVGCVCLSVGTSTRVEDLQRIWGTTSHLRMDDALGLGAHVESLFGTAMRAALAATHGSNGRRPSPARRAAA